jgi:putative membrane protein
MALTARRDGHTLAGRPAVRTVATGIVWPWRNMTRPFLFGNAVFGLIGACVLFLVVIAAIVLLVLWITRTTRTTQAAAQAQAPLDVLKARYARGEVTKEQYEEIKKELGG